MPKRQWLSVVLMGVAASASTDAGATALGDLASSMQPGTWAELPTTGFNSALLSDTGGHHILQFSDDIIWDPNGKQLLFVGGGHQSDAAFIAYSEATNTWRKLSLGWGGSFSHAYDHSAIIPGRNTLYHRRPETDRVWQYNIGTGTWSTTSTFSPDFQCCGALEYFPDLDRLIFIDGDWGVFSYNPNNNTWAKVSNALAIGDYHNVAEYSPVHRVLIFGGGGGNAEGAASNRAVYKMAATGAITQVRSSPINFGIYDTVTTTDPISGNILLFGDRDSYEYNPANDTWTRFAGAGAFVAGSDEGDSFSSVATPIAEYGVVLVATWNFDQSKIWLYKHSPGNPQPLPTVALTANPVSVAAQGTTTLTWVVANATSCTASSTPAVTGWSGAKTATGGTQASVGPITVNTTFRLACTGPGGSTTGTAGVTVPGSSSPPTVNLQASPTTVSPGTRSQLTWTSTNATGCAASNGWAGTKAVNGTQQSPVLNATTVFDLECTGAGGTGTDSVTVTVSANAPPAPTVTLNASATTVEQGGSATLTWTSTNATACTASGGWTGGRAVNGNETLSSLTTTATYSLQCSGAGGSASAQQTVAVTAPSTTPPVGSSGKGAVSWWMLPVLLLLAAARALRNARVQLALMAALFAGQTNAQTPEEDFQARASHPDVVRAVGFDTQAQVTNHVHADGFFERSGSGWDQSVRASGGGSVRFNIPSQSEDAAGGSWRINFSDSPFAVQFGANEEFFVQWRQRFDSNFLSTYFNNGNGWKQVIIAEGDVVGREAHACVETELVVQNSYQRGLPQLYHSCSVFEPFEESFGGDYKLQNAIPAPYCLYSNNQEGGPGNTTTQPPCFGYVPNEWLTFQIRVKLGPRGTAFSSLEGRNVTGFTNTIVQMWAARNGQPAVLIHDWSGIVLRESNGVEYGKIWLLPFHTNKSSSQVHPEGRTWYDELIVSRSRISDPGVPAGSGPGVSLTASPVTVTAQGTTTLTWVVTNATSCTASSTPAVSGWSGTKSATAGTQAGVGPITTTTTFRLNCTGAGGSGSGDAIVTVPGSTPTVDLQASPTTVNAGARTQLSWTSTNATGCSASGGWAGSKLTSGSQQSPVLNTTTVFNLMCTGPGGQASDSVTVTVNGSPPPAPTVTLDTSASSVAQGGSVTLTWTSTNATSCTASGGWTGSKALNGNQTLSSLTTTQTYTLQCSGAGGNASAQQTVTVTAEGTAPSEGGGGVLAWWMLSMLGLMAARTQTRCGRARRQ